ncbi:serine phosphatase RsbU (regulator of sigma subunit) [Streptomyces sp. Ag109_O5-1]|uniref:PP2C family protein-serine/threonine phosphatase n=1 Tax=Streptomyces sp. Ag109_O5-1 TaxID=1938851 RepID=UPI000F4FE0F4|nr:PP2C family protein-serine/threonine phosphatase [Streptomyces sp. Ag109_O5-1]RPE42695.1 serine phosphatase RsbU (regulator of sigma subunit) [Streptomyces sp. Ag109_O5-1]
MITTSLVETLRGWRRSAPAARWLAGPILVIVAIPVADGFLPPDIHLAHLLVVAVAVTAVGTGPLSTALIGALAVLALVLAGLERRTLATESVLVELAALVTVCAFLVLFTHLRDRRERELVRVRSVSDAAQRVVLRPLPKRAGPVTLASHYRSAEVDATIGGDLYAAARIPGSTRLLIGDVRGKGLPSISDTAIVLGAFRAAAHRRIPLPELVAYIEDAVRWGLAEFSEPAEDAAERFVTAAVMDIPDDEPVVHLISCGHPPPLLLGRTRTTLALTVPEPAPPLGLGDTDGADGYYVPATFPFEHGDRLFLYTDGVSEARNADGDFYPLAERAGAWADKEPGPLVERLAADVRAYAGSRLNDDMAMIVVQRD